MQVTQPYLLAAFSSTRDCYGYIYTSSTFETKNTRDKTRRQVIFIAVTALALQYAVGVASEIFIQSLCLAY